MCPKNRKNRQAAFTLVELIVVVAILGVVTVAISNLYISTQRTAGTTEEVSDVQQNIRVAVDFLTRDIRNSGLLIPAGQPAVSAAPYFLCRDLDTDGDCADAGEFFSFTVQTASPLGKIARVLTAFTSLTNPTDDNPVEVTAADMVDLFDSGAEGDFVRIFRPGSSAQTPDLIYRVAGKDRGPTPPDPADPPVLTLEGFDDDYSFPAGSLVVGIPVSGGPYAAGVFPASASGPPVSTITYTLVDDPDSNDPNMHRLLRQVSNSGGAQLLAGKITDIEISYIMKNGSSRTLASGSAAPAGTELRDIAAVSLSIQGATDARVGVPGASDVKARGIETTVKIRNL